MEETDRLFACQFCRVHSYLMPHKYFRYAFPHAARENQELVYFPFWRFKGMLFFCGPSGIANRFVDVSHQAILTPYFPASVGVRSQAMKLRFVSADMNGRFLKPSRSFDEMSADLEKRFGKSVAKPILHRAHVGESLSLIYSPYYLKDRLYDAILNEPVMAKAPGDLDLEEFEVAPPKGHIRFVSTLCPKCGWDLEGRRDALVLTCPNCNSAWYPAGRSLKQLKFARIPGHGASRLYLPFWRIKAKISGIRLDSCADLIRVANLVRAVHDDWADRSFRFWIPAFKIRPRLFLRLASHMTVSQPNQELIRELPSRQTHPGTLPVTEAVESLGVTLADFMKPRRKLMEKFPDIKIDAQSFTLVFIPFDEAHQEFIQHEFKIAINKNALALSTHL